MSRRRCDVLVLLPLLAMLGTGCKSASETAPKGKVADEETPAAEKAALDVEAACTLDATAWVAGQLVTACQWIPAGLDEDRLPLAPWKPEPGKIEGLPIRLTRWKFDDALWYVRQEGAARPWLLAAEHDVPASRINAVIDDLAKMGATEGRVLVRTEAGPRRDEPRDPSSFAHLQAELEKLSDDEQYKRLRSSLREYAADCEATGDRVDAMLMLAPGVPCETRTELTRELLVACDCPSWGDAFVASLRLLVGREMPFAAVEVALAPDAALRPDDDDTWGAFVEKLGPGKVTLRSEEPGAATQEPDDESGMDLAALREAARKEREKAQVVQDAPQVEGLNADIVRRIIRAHINEVRHCYQRAIEEDPKLAGKLEVAFPIRADGRPGTATVRSSTLESEDMGECVVSAVARWTFPRPTSGEAQVVQSFRFSRTD